MLNFIINFLESFLDIELITEGKRDILKGKKAFSKKLCSFSKKRRIKYRFNLYHNRKGRSLREYKLKNLTKSCRKNGVKTKEKSQKSLIKRRAKNKLNKKRMAKLKR